MDKPVQKPFAFKCAGLVGIAAVIYLCAAVAEQRTIKSHHDVAARELAEGAITDFEVRLPDSGLEELAKVIRRQRAALDNLGLESPQLSKTSAATDAVLQRVQQHQAKLMDNEAEMAGAASSLSAVADAASGHLLGRKLQELSQDLKDQVEMQQLESASDLSLMFSAAYFAMMGFYIILSQADEDLGVIQRSALKQRIAYVLTLCLYICFFSCLFNVVQSSDADDLQVGEVNHTLDLGRPIEWILTCPINQLAIAIFGGEKVHDIRRYQLPSLSLAILTCGIASAFMQLYWLKMVLYLCGLTFFVLLCLCLNEAVREASGKTESLWRGTSDFRTVCIYTIASWLPFPIWYALSPEGFNIITNSPLMKVAVAFLNVFSKGWFVLYCMRVQSNERVREAVQDVEHYAKRSDEYTRNREENHHVASRMLFENVAATLRKIGRAKDFDNVMALLEANMITSTEEIGQLTEPYCKSIGLPWAFVFAFNETQKHAKLRELDTWTLSTEDMKKEYEDHKQNSAYANQKNHLVLASAPHIAANPAKLRAALHGTNFTPQTKSMGTLQAQWTSGTNHKGEGSDDMTPIPGDATTAGTDNKDAYGSRSTPYYDDYQSTNSNGNGSRSRMQYGGSASPRNAPGSRSNSRPQSRQASEAGDGPPVFTLHEDEAQMVENLQGSLEMMRREEGNKTRAMEARIEGFLQKSVDEQVSQSIKPYMNY
jgi:bacteriorhodopsin